MEYQ